MTIEKLDSSDFAVLAGLADGFVPNPQTSIALIARDGEDIVGRIFLMAPAHMEGPWIREDKRNGTLAGRLVASIENEAKSAGISRVMAYAVSSEIENYLSRLGYQKLPFTVWSKDI